MAYALQTFWSREGHGDDSATLMISGEGKVHEEARAYWPTGMKIPVLNHGELEDFLGPKEEATMIDICKDETEQYSIFLRNQLDFEGWRRNQGRIQ